MIPATNIQSPLESSVIYLQAKPLEIIKKRKSKYRNNSTRIKEKSGKNDAGLKILSQQDNYKIKQETNMNETDEHINPNDPLFTPTQVVAKCEVHKEINEEYEHEFDTEQEKYKDFSIEEDEGGDYDEEEDYDCKGNDGSHDVDDEPLILLTRARPTTYKKHKKRPRLHNCLETCKYKCITKFNKQQRLDIFDYYWNLSKEKKVNFIRQHTRKPILAKVRTKKGRNNCRYFLKYYCSNYGINEESQTDSPKDDNDDDLIKVCRKFFENTVGVSGLEIKEAIEGYALKKEKIKLPAKDIINKNVVTVSQNIAKKIIKPQMFLDPETGNLTDTKPKIKTKRRKPGDPLPERFPKPINCDIRCRFKCHLNFTEEERKKLCDMFWSLDFKRRKDFILARIEKNEVESVTTPEFRKSNRPVRSYQAKFFLRSSPNGENKRVCKHFIMNTLRINRHFIENAMEFADETTGFYTGTDRRGGATAATIKQSQERKQQVMQHISSYPCWLPNKKSKTKYLHHSLSIRKMYEAFKDKCLAEQQKFVSTCYYYTVFHNEFRLAFLSNPQQKKKVQLSNPNVSHYTGEEPGGYWVDSKNNKLHLGTFNPAESLNVIQQNSSTALSKLSTDAIKSSESSDAYNLLNITNPNTYMPANQSTSVVVRSDLNPSLYELFFKGP